MSDDDAHEPTMKGDAGDAAAWVVRMHSDQVTSADEAAFAAWLAADPSHRAAYDAIAATWQGAGRALRDDRELRDMMQRLRSEDAAPRPSLARRAFFGATAAALALVAGTGTWGALEFAFAPPVYATAFGEQRRIALDDGSVVMLNTESRLRVELGSAERRLWLEKGQAHFTVAKDRARPFRVFVDAEEVRALGTQFEVRREAAGRMRVTLEEGTVALFTDGAARSAAKPVRPQAVMKPGEQALIAPGDGIMIAKVNAETAAAWRFGKMVLDARPLSEAVAEINRYNTRRIVVADPRLRSLLISGVFQTGRPEAFVETLTKAFPVKVARETAETIELASAKSP